MSLPEPSWPFGKSWMSIRPDVFSFTSFAILSAIRTCGCVGASSSPQRITVAWARSTVGIATPAAATPSISRRLSIVVLMASSLSGRSSGLLPLQPMSMARARDIVMCACIAATAASASFRSIASITLR